MKKWLDKYEDGGEYLGTTNKGFNYNGAWGGPSMQNGGLTFLEPTSRKLPKGYVIPHNTPSTELAMSIGGENGEPAYLIPSFKHGKYLTDKDAKAEFRKTGEHLGGPFKTWQEADEWERTVRHPYVEKGQNIPTPFRRWGKDFAMGGSLPGAVEFTYARTQGAAPSNGPYAKKTKASAQDGKNVEYKELPEIVVVGGKDKPTVDLYRNELNKLKFDSDNPYYGVKEFADYYAKMQMAKEFGVPRVRPKEPIGEIGSFFRNRSGIESDPNKPWPQYSPFSKTVFSGFSDNGEYHREYIPELSHYVSQTKRKEWLLSDKSYNKALLSDLWEYAKGNSPYNVEGTEENFAHFQLEPAIDDTYHALHKEGWKKFIDAADNAARRKLYEDRKKNKLQDGKEIEYKEIPEITLTGLGEIIYKHSPSSQGYYELSKTATPFTSKRQIKENINAPKSPKDVNFISNYRGALGGIDKYPTSVPFEGEKHWNIDRFIIDPAFGNSYPALESGQSKKQLKLNVLSDMYKYNMLQGQNKDDAFRNAKKFMRQEINPRINNSFFKNVILGNADPYTSSITNFANENPISIKRSRDEFVKENPNNIFFKRYAENPWSEAKNRNVIMDYLKDYKKMSSKDARKQYRDWKKEADEEAIRKKEELKNHKPLPASFSFTEEYKDGGEMQYYQQGLDWKPKNISKNGDMIPKAQPGKILPKWQQRLQEEAAKLDSPLSTLNLSKKGYTKDEIKTIQSSAKKEQPVIQSAKTVTNPILEEQQRRRMARVAADKYGMKFNEETGKVEKALNLSPQTDKTLRKASENIVEPMIDIEGAMGAGSLIKTGLKKGYSSLLRYPIFKDIDRKFVYPIQFRNEIAELKKLHAAAPERFSTGEAAERLKNVLGINPKDIDQPLLTFTPEGSYYYSPGNVINIDLRQAKQLAKESGLTPKGVYGHEYGHFLQREAHRHSEEFAKELMDYQEQLARYNSPENLEMLNDPDVWLLGKNRDKVVFNPGMAPLPRPQSTLIDKYANEVYNVTPTGIDMEPMSRYAFENSDYFTYRDLEQMPHLREMRQGMLDKGYIKDLYEPISEGTIQRFIAENPTDRISSFTNPNNQERIKGLQKIFRNLPAVVPAIGAAATLDKKKKGGKVKKDDMGYWNPENWGEPVEIDSNEITMQGVYEPLIGISDTGDVQYMEPGEDYTFDGESVTEYPVMQNGGRAPIYVDNPNDPRLRAYQDSANVYNDFLRLKKMMDSKYASNEDYYVKKEDYPRNPDGSICYNCIKKEAERKKAKGQFYSKDKQGFTQLVDPNIDPRGYINYLKDNPVFDESVGKFQDYSNARPKQPVQYKKSEQKKDKFGLTEEDLKKVFSADGKGWTATPGQKADGYYRYKKGNTSYKIYTSSGGFSHAEIEKPKPPAKTTIEQVVKKEPKKLEWNKLYDLEEKPVPTKSKSKVEPKKEVVVKKSEQPIERKVVQEPIVESKKPLPQGYPVYGPSQSLIGMYDEKSRKFYPDYTNKGARAKVNQQDTDLIANEKTLQDYLYTMGYRNFEIEKKKSGGWLDKYN